MTVIYHSRDLDGWCSGAILQKRYPEARMIGYDYGEPIPLTEKDYEDDLIMADVSFPAEDMVALATEIDSKGKTFTWIDHHLAILKEMTAYSNLPMTMVLDTSIAACELCWNYCFPEDAMSPAVELLGKYDSWRNQDKKEWNELILPFQYGMRVLCNSLDTFPSALLMDAKRFNIHPAIADIIDTGRSILKYQDMQNEKACGAAFEADFAGYKAICLNIGGASSNTFKSVYDESKHDIMIPFTFSKDKWIVSLYTTHNIDCSALAKAWGGGGHAKAAGFQVNDIRDVFPLL
jgi:oligoribonuclease NrnB/cAMP/cGMP phosphodiesterase (DHH superfamily)